MGLRKNEKGFTLTELFIVIAIIAVTGTVAAPNLIAWRDNTRTGSAARDLYTDLQQAKIKAVETSKYCAISLDNTSYAVFLDENKNLQLDSGEEIVVKKYWSEYGTTILDTAEGGGDGLTLSNPDNCIAFASNGLPLDNTGSLGSGAIFLTNNYGKKSTNWTASWSSC